MAELIKKIYELGFEVGNKNHSEIGWVLRQYNELTDKASKLGIKSPDSYYADGKTKGKASRDKNVEGTKTPEKATAPVRKVVTTAPVVESDIHNEESGFDHRMQRPSLSNIPKFVEKCSATEIPAFLEGFKLNKRK